MMWKKVSHFYYLVKHRNWTPTAFVDQEQLRKELYLIARARARARARVRARARARARELLESYNCVYVLSS